MNRYLKKLISTAMALFMLLSASSAVFADENVPVSNDSSEIELYAYTGTETVDLNDITYTFDYDNKTLTINGTGQITSYYTNQIMKRYQNGNIKTVIINDGITSIGDNAFNSFDITSLTLPYTLKSIGYKAFYNSLHVDKLIIPSSVKTIDTYAFEMSAVTDGVYLEGYTGSTPVRYGNNAWGATVNGASSASTSSNVYHLSDVEIEPIEDQVYKGIPVTPDVTVKLITKDTEGATQLETTLRNGIDYVASYENNTELGTAAVNISYIGDYSNYAGDVKTTTFDITQCDISNATVNAIPTQMYTGNEITPKPVVKFRNETLTEGVDYTISYKNNVKPNNFWGQTPQIIITGIGDYTGEKTIDFTITSESYTLSYPYEIVYEFGYEPMYLTDFLTLTCSDGTILKGSEIGNISAYGVDDIGGMGYQCDWEAAAAVEFFISSFSSEASKHGIATEMDYYIVPLTPYTFTDETKIDLSISTDLGDAEYDADSYLRLPSQTYTGNPIKPSILSMYLYGDRDLMLGDVQWNYSNNVDVGEASLVLSGNNTFVTGLTSIPFTIEPCDLSDISIDVETDIEYEGYEVIPEITATYNGMTLVEGKDYDVAYTNNNAVGTATATIIGKGNYAGTVEKIFEITSPMITAENTTIGTIAPLTYSKSSLTPEPEVRLGNTVLTKDVDYTLSYENNVNVGTATVKVTGIGKYEGEVMGTFTIEPKNANYFIVVILDDWQ